MKKQGVTMLNAFLSGKREVQLRGTAGGPLTVEAKTEYSAHTEYSSIELQWVTCETDIRAARVATPGFVFAATYYDTIKMEGGTLFFGQGIDADMVSALHSFPKSTSSAAFAVLDAKDAAPKLRLAADMVGRDETRVISAVLLASADEGFLHVVSTDTNAMAVAAFNRAPGSAIGGRGLIAPATAKFLASTVGDVEVAFPDSMHITAKTRSGDRVSIVSVMGDGVRYPDYTRVVLGAIQHELLSVRVQTSHFIDACQRAIARFKITGGAAHAPVAIDFKSDRLDFCRDIEGDSFSHTIPSQGHCHDGIAVAVSAKKLLLVGKTAGTESLAISVYMQDRTGNRVLVIRPDLSWTVVMACDA